MPLPLPSRLFLQGAPLLLLPLLAACASSAPPPAAAAPIRVAAAPAQAAPDHLQLSFPAQLRASQRSLLAPQVGGQLLSRVELGRQVQAGETLARLNTPGLQPQLAAAAAEVEAVRAQRDKARDDEARARSLRARGLLAQEAADAARSSLDALQARLAAAEAQREAVAASAAEQTLRAPADGTVVRVLAEPGEFVAAGQPLLEIAGDLGLEFELQLPPRIANALDVGQRIELATLDGRRHRAELVEHPGQAAAQAARAAGLINLRFALLDDSEGETVLASGEPVEARIRIPTPAGSAVPLAALRATGGLPPVHLLLPRDGHARALEVEPLALIGDQALVRPVAATELPPGTPVIVAAPSALRAGDRIELLP